VGYHDDAHHRETAILEVVRRTFVEGKGVAAEEQDWKSRELPLDARSWSGTETRIVRQGHHKAIV
jgi:hypothetical protein